MIEKLFLAGADVFRLNFSHGSQEQKKELLDIIRGIEEKYSHPIAILGDLQGPKLRVGEFSNPNGEVLETGQTFRFDLDAAKGDNKRVMLPHPEIIAASEEGHILMIDDGKVKMTVTKKGQGFLECRVDVGGKISNRKVRIQFHFLPLLCNFAVPISSCVLVSSHDRVSTLPTPFSRSVP
jgi:pyruvate kinase